MLKDEEELPARSVWKPGKAPALLAEAAIRKLVFCKPVIYFVSHICGESREPAGSAVWKDTLIAAAS